MKVHIGPYPTFKKGSKRTERKVSIHIDPYDVWSMDGTLSMIILPMLKQLKKVKNGAPCVANEDVPRHLRTKMKYDGRGTTDKNFFKRWDWVLGELIWTFTQLTTDWDKQYSSGKSQLMQQAYDENNQPLGKPVLFAGKKKSPEGAKSFRIIEGPKHTFKTDFKARAKHEARIQKGLILFGKYFQNLWD